MPDMIPASKIAAAALSQVREAQAVGPASRYDTEAIERQKVHLKVAAELLALIADPPQMAHPAGDGTLTIIPPGSPPRSYPAPTSPVPPKK